MTSIGDIFDLQDDIKKEEQQEKKPRKKAEISDEKKAAMLERLKAGREKRAENLKAKAQPKEEIVIKKEVNKEVISKKEKEVVKKTNEDERLSFIKMMAGKEKNGEKFERPKKKIVSTPKEEPQKQEATNNKQPKVINEVAAPIAAPIVSAPVAVVKVPVIIRTFKKPIWG